MNKLADKLVLASDNQGKLKEFQQIFAPYQVELINQGRLNICSAEETGLSFVENAILKARHACQLSGLPALADDSGISVDYLHGAPGIYSARFSGENANDSSNNEKLLRLLDGVDDSLRSASFHCVLVLMQHAKDPTPLICHGIWHGRLLNAPQGQHGFGYDPVFYVPEYQCSSAELEPAIKNQISHRGKAVAQLIQALSTDA